MLGHEFGASQAKTVDQVICQRAGSGNSGLADCRIRGAAPPYGCLRRILTTSRRLCEFFPQLLRAFRLMETFDDRIGGRKPRRQSSGPRHWRQYLPGHIGFGVT